MNFVFLSPIAWDNSGGAHRPVQFAQELVRRGHRVTYVEIEKSRAAVPTDNPRVLDLEALGWDTLNLTRAWYGLDYSSPARAAEQLLSGLPQDDAPGYVICSAPFRPVLELQAALAAAGYVPVYDVLDDISEMRPLGSYCYDDVAEAYLADNAACVIALSPRLCEKFRALERVTLVRDGVDPAPFRQPTTDARPTETYARGRITLGFWGTMWEYNLDVPLLQELVRHRPDWQWHFIGPYDLDPSRPSIAQALAAPNVHFHQSISRAALAQAAHAFDVCILPTPVTPFNLARDPLKVYEYLACHKPVVSTNLTQLAGMPYVTLTDSADAFAQAVEGAAQTLVDPVALDAYLDEQTWIKRTDALLDALSPLLAQGHARAHSLPPPPTGAMPGAADELDRWHAYARHVERLVQDREAHVRDLEAALQQSSLAEKFKRAVRL